MDKINREIADNAKFLAGALARVSPLPEVLLEIIWGYMDLWHILRYTSDLAENPIPGIMPSISPMHLLRTLNILSLHNFRIDQMVRAVCCYEIPDQIRILNSLMPDDVIRLFHVKSCRIKRRLKASKHHKGKRGEHMLAVLVNCLEPVQFVLSGQLELR
jgi:hypothetical protein